MSVLDRSSPLALGTAVFGTLTPAMEAFGLLDAYVAAGGNHLDTAHDYASWLPGGDGASERTIGAWLRRAGGRERLLIATKAGCTRIGQKRIRREILRTELCASLDRLGVSCVELFWLHRDDPAVPVAEILGWVEELRREGLFITCGASNWTSARLAGARAAADALGVPGLCASQCGYNLAVLSAREMPLGDAHFLSAADVRWHEGAGFPLVAYEAQAGGFFSGRYQPAAKPSSSRAHAVTAHYATPANWRRLALAQAIAATHGASANQVALAWLRQHRFRVIPIIGPGSLAQLDDSLGALRIELSPDEMALLGSGDARAP